MKCNSRYASFGYSSAMRRAGGAFCGYTGVPRVYKPCNSIVEMTLDAESEITRLALFLLVFLLHGKLNIL